MSCSFLLPNPTTSPFPLPRPLAPASPPPPPLCAPPGSHTQPSRTSHQHGSRVQGGSSRANRLKRRRSSASCAQQQLTPNQGLKARWAPRQPWSSMTRGQMKWRSSSRREATGSLSPPAPSVLLEPMPRCSIHAQTRLCPHVFSV